MMTQTKNSEICCKVDNNGNVKSTDHMYTSQYYLSPNNVIKKTTDSKLPALTSSSPTSYPVTSAALLATSYKELSTKWTSPVYQHRDEGRGAAVKMRSKSCETDMSFDRVINLKLEIKPSDIRRRAVRSGESKDAVMITRDSRTVSVDALDLAKSEAMRIKEKRRKRVSFAI